jgi:uracil-DNA glycosylase
MNFTREDANNMTREDVLRELELLPVWKLRAPLKPEATMSQVSAIETPAVEVEIAAVVAEAVRYTCTISDDKKWAFIWPASLILPASQSTLFSNILVALKISKSNQTVIESLANIEVSIIIAMGEVAAQQVLSTTEPIETLRGKTHQSISAPLIVTYHPNDMLQDLQLKAKTWEDLCLAKRIVLGK